MYTKEEREHFIGLSDDLSGMENTSGWKRLVQKLETDKENLIDDILRGTEEDDMKRGELSKIQELFAWIKQIHETARGCRMEEV